VPVHVIGGTGDDLIGISSVAVVPVSIPVPAAAFATFNDEISPATVIDPDSSAILPPTVAFTARGLAALLCQPDPASCIGLAVVPASIIGRARDSGGATLVRIPRIGAAATPVLVGVNDEIGPAAAVYPNAATIKSPAVPLIAGGVAALLRQLHPSPRIGGTIVPPAIVGRTRNALGRAALGEKQRCRNHAQ
jgi:hypothetical protein